MLAIIGFFFSALAIANSEPLLPCNVLPLKGADHAIQHFVCGIGSTAKDQAGILQSLDCMKNITPEACTGNCDWCQFDTTLVKAETIRDFGVGVCGPKPYGELCKASMGSLDSLATIAAKTEEFFPKVDKHYECLKNLKSSAECAAQTGCQAFPLDDQYKWGKDAVLCLKTADLAGKETTIGENLKLKNTGGEALVGDSTTVTAATTRAIQATTNSTNSTSGTFKTNAFGAVALSLVTVALAYEFAI